MKSIICISLILIIHCNFLFSQVGINNDGTMPDISAMLDVKSTDKGFLMPRLTRSQLATITSPAAGLMIFCIDCASNNTGALIIYSGSSWFQFDLRDCYAMPQPPAEGVHDSSFVLIAWDWNPVSGATGYKWNNTDNYATATDKDTATYHTESGLTAGTFYTRYVWSYNSCGYSAPTVLTSTTLTCSTMAVWHQAGDVAPVDKFTVYTLVVDVPGEPEKCWIKKNLGASNPAATVDDATEAAAGWYWQFNKKQGYKHTGTVRTPNTAWITAINQNSNWVSSQDPCTLELGDEWRIPTDTELQNIDNAGSWGNWNGPWDSALKMHGAGYLTETLGSLNSRGYGGYYWASQQSSNNYGYLLHFSTPYCFIDSFDKATALTLRCLKE